MPDVKLTAVLLVLGSVPSKVYFIVVTFVPCIFNVTDTVADVKLAPAGLGDIVGICGPSGLLSVHLPSLYHPVVTDGFVNSNV